MIVAVNAGTHANPCYIGVTIKAWSEVLGWAETNAPGVAAPRLCLVAFKGSSSEFVYKTEEGKYHHEVLLDIDYSALVPA